MAEKKVAIIIGIGVYDSDEIPDLDYAESDARAFYRRLIDPAIGGYEKSNVYLYESPGKMKLSIDIYNLLINTQPKDSILFYFSGHGLKDHLGQLFLGTRDTKPDSIPPTAISASELWKQFKDCLSNQICLILDCCYAGALAAGEGLKSMGSEAEFAQEFARQVESLGGGGTVTLASSLGSQLSSEAEKYGGSVFSHFILEGIDGAADTDSDGVITTTELYNYVAARMGEAVGQEQRPVFMGEIVGKDFVLVRSKRIQNEILQNLRDEIDILRKERKHNEALHRLKEFATTDRFNEREIEKLRIEVEQERDKMRKDYWDILLVEGKDIKFGGVLHDILQLLSKKPDLIFSSGHKGLKEKLIRLHFMGKIDGSDLVSEWPPVPLIEGPRPSGPPEPPGPVIEKENPDNDIEKPWWAKHLRVLVVSTIVVLLIMVVAVILYHIIQPPVYPIKIHVGIVEKDSWKDRNEARKIIGTLYNRLDQKLAGTLLEGDKARYEIVMPEKFIRKENLIKLLKEEKVDIVGELTPYWVCRVNSEAGAVPFISPMYGNSSTYFSVVLLNQMSTNINARGKGDLDWDWLLNYLLENDVRIAVAEKESTSGYWYPRKLIMDGLVSVAKKNLLKSFEDVTEPVTKGPKEILKYLEQGNMGVIAGAMAEFRYTNLCKPGNDTIPIPDLCKSIKEVGRTEGIPHGAFLLRKELASDKKLLDKLRANWETEVMNVLEMDQFDNARDVLPERWERVDISHYATVKNIMKAGGFIAQSSVVKRNIVIMAAAILLIAALLVVYLQFRETSRDKK